MQLDLRPGEIDKLIMTIREQIFVTNRQTGKTHAMNRVTKHAFVLMDTIMLITNWIDLHIKECSEGITGLAFKYATKKSLRKSP
jgi:hypothetical protein